MNWKWGVKKENDTNREYPEIELGFRMIRFVLLLDPFFLSRCEQIVAVL